MINKIYKRIHNKYLTLFKFLFFLRYLFGIFFISLFLFLSIPYFFDLKKKEQIIKNYLSESYGLTLNRFENIEYNLLPTPNFEIRNANLDGDIANISNVPYFYFYAPTKWFRNMTFHIGDERI